MGEVTKFPATKFRIIPPARPLSPTERVVAAYQVVDACEEALRLGNGHTTGIRILARAALISLMNVEGKAAALELVRRTVMGGPGSSDDHGGAAA